MAGMEVNGARERGPSSLDIVTAAHSLFISAIYLFEKSYDFG